MFSKKNITRCPECGKEAGFFRLLAFKKQHFYKCRYCEKESELSLDSRLFKLAGLCILIASIVTIVFSFVDVNFVILGITIDFIVFGFFYARVPFFVNLEHLSKTDFKSISQDSEKNHLDKFDTQTTI